MEITGKQMNLFEASGAVGKELSLANDKFPLFTSKHEGFAILKEEVDELWEDIKSKDATNSQIQAECIQVAAMAIKFLTSPIFGK